MKKQSILLIILAFSLIIFSVFALNSCDGDETEDGEENATKEYSIEVVDVNENAIAGVIITVKKGEEQVKIAKTNQTGAVKFELPTGAYTFNLTFSGDKEYHYDESLCVLSEDEASVSVTVANLPYDTYELYNECEAGLIEVGTYFVELSASNPSYFLFTPSERGRYKLSVSSNVKASCEYYGSPMIIYDNDISNESDREKDSEGNLTGSIFMDFRSFNVNSTQYLFGVKAEGEGSGYFTIEKISDLELSPEEIPYSDYMMTHTVKDFVFSGGTLVNFDISNLSLSAVYNPDDGFYHLNSADGPVIYMKLTVPTAYTVALEKICETQPFQHYIYDDDGKFVGKISYCSMMLKYFEAADETAGVYPLTEDLKVAIQDMGDFLGWYKPAAAGESHIFFGDTPVTANAWLFACCYVQP